MGLGVNDTLELLAQLLRANGRLNPDYARLNGTSSYTNPYKAELILETKSLGRLHSSNSKYYSGINA